MSTEQMSRSRIITWEDPISAVYTGKTSNGIEYTYDSPFLKVQS